MAEHGKTPAKRRQTRGKSLYCDLKKFFPAHQKMCTAHQKNIICTAKNGICTSKKAISTFSHTLGMLLSFWHTFSYLPIFSQLLAHCRFKQIRRTTLLLSRNRSKTWSCSILLQGEKRS